MLLDNTLKKSVCNTLDISVSIAVSMLLRPIALYMVERLQPSSRASHPAECPCLSSSSFMIWPMFTIPFLFFRLENNLSRFAGALRN